MTRQKRAPAAPERFTIGALVEPDWEHLLNDARERSIASEHWRRVAQEMENLQTLSASNGHAIQRLVMAYIVYDRCSNIVAADGLVTKPAENNPKAIARLSIHYKAMREAETTAERLEAQLGLTPGRRGKVGKVTRARERSTGADAFLGPKG